MTLPSSSSQELNPAKRGDHPTEDFFFLKTSSDQHCMLRPSEDWSAGVNPVNYTKARIRLITFFLDHIWLQPVLCNL